MRPAHARRGRARSSTPSRTGRTCSVAALGRRLVFAADEYYLLADRPFPPAEHVRGLPDARGRHRHGPHVRARVHRPGRRADRRRSRVLRLGRRRAGRGLPRAVPRPRCGRTRRGAGVGRRCAPSPRRARSAILTGEYGARVLAPLVGDARARRRAGASPVANEFFGGNIGVTGLMVGDDLARVLAGRAGRPSLPAARRLPLRGPLPRRHHARRPAPARSRSWPPTASPCGARPRRAGVADGASEPARRRHRRPAQRRQVHAAQPHRRPARRHRRGAARGHPRPQGGRGRVAGRPVPAGRHRRLAAAAATRSTRR